MLVKSIWFNYEVCFVFFFPRFSTTFLIDAMLGYSSVTIFLKALYYLVPWADHFCTVLLIFGEKTGIYSNESFIIFDFFLL